MEIYAIMNGNVQPHILDPNFEKYLPVIPSEVSTVNFTWKSGNKKYYYNFDTLKSYDPQILGSPVTSIKTKGKVPKRPKEFSVLLPCNGNSSGIAKFGISLQIETRRGKPLKGTPLNLTLKKECSQRSTYNRFLIFEQNLHIYLFWLLLQDLLIFVFILLFLFISNNFSSSYSRFL